LTLHHDRWLKWPSSLATLVLAIAADSGLNGVYLVHGFVMKALMEIIAKIAVRDFSAAAIWLLSLPIFAITSWFRHAGESSSSCPR
jgi:hypothetical protein